MYHMYVHTIDVFSSLSLRMHSSSPPPIPFHLLLFSQFFVQGFWKVQQSCSSGSKCFPYIFPHGFNLELQVLYFVGVVLVVKHMIATDARIAIVLHMKSDSTLDHTGVVFYFVLGISPGQNSASFCFFRRVLEPLEARHFGCRPIGSLWTWCFGRVAGSARPTYRCIRLVDQRRVIGVARFGMMPTVFCGGLCTFCWMRRELMQGCGVQVGPGRFDGEVGQERGSRGLGMWWCVGM